MMGNTPSLHHNRINTSLSLSLSLSLPVTFVSLIFILFVSFCLFCLSTPFSCSMFGQDGGGDLPRAAMSQEQDAVTKADGRVSKLETDQETLRKQIDVIRKRARSEYDKNIPGFQEDFSGEIFYNGDEEAIIKGFKRLAEFEKQLAV